jgi:hypothetical protein
MPDNLDIHRAEREFLRWIIITALWHARPYGCHERIILRAAQDMPLQITTDQLRQEMDYVEESGFCKIDKNGELWHAKITPKGTDLVDYREDCPKGIARPPKW